MKRIVIDWLEMTANSQDIKIQILKRDMDPYRRSTERLDRTGKTTRCFGRQNNTKRKTKVIATTSRDKKSYVCF